MTDFSKRNFYYDFIEDERQFYLHEAGFDEREERLFRLRTYEKKTLWQAGDIMGYSRRTMDRINEKMIKKIINSSPLYYRGISMKWR